MIASFQSIAPIFLLILLGNFLRKTPIFSAEFWSGLEKMGFYVLYPTLLFIMIFKADFSGLALGKIMIVLTIAWTTLCFITLGLWPILRKIAISRPTFSSIFQSSIRWNGFIALVIAENMFPPEGAAMVALVMAAIVIPINVMSVVVVAWFTDASPNLGSVFMRVSKNPLIIGAGLGLLCRLIPSGLPIVILDTLDLIGRAALGMGLMAIGAGLRFKDVLMPSISVIIPTLLKLFIFPLLVTAVAIWLGISNQEILYLALCASVPTAMNGYVLARQMGGDAECYAVTATLQTMLAFVTIPIILSLVAQLTGG